MVRIVSLFRGLPLFLAGVAALHAAPETPATPFERELRSLAGTWRPVSAENNGYRASAGDLGDSLWTRSPDGHWTMYRGGKPVVEWTVKAIDATRSPKAIDLEVASGVYRGIVYLGIYSLEGDTLRICFALPDRPLRPTEFLAGMGTVRALTEFKRVKSE